MSPRAGTARYMTPGRWAVIAGMVIVLILLALNLYYQWVQSGIWQEERTAVQRAKDDAGLAEVKQADKFVWDESVWVVQGKDDDGTLLYVWVAEDSVSTVAAADAYPADRLKSDVRRAYPDADIIRVRPGIVEGERIWEVYYGRVEQDVPRHYYSFYDFENGSLLTTYRLPSRTAS